VTPWAYQLNTLPMLGGVGWRWVGSVGGGGGEEVGGLIIVFLDFFVFIHLFYIVYQSFTYVEYCVFLFCLMDV
jgi:hypothetical protein